jgi:hypothetical protein
MYIVGDAAADGANATAAVRHAKAVDNRRGIVKKGPEMRPLESL